MILLGTDHDHSLRLLSTTTRLLKLPFSTKIDDLTTKVKAFFMALVSLKFMDLDVYMWKKKLSLAKGQKGISKFEVSMKSHEQKHVNCGNLKTTQNYLW